MRSQDEVYLRVFNDYEDVPATFRIAGKVPVHPGRYDWTNINALLETTNARPDFGPRRCHVLQLLQRRLFQDRFQARYPAVRADPVHPAIHLHPYQPADGPA